MEQSLVDQVRERLAAVGMTQDELAKRAFGEHAGRQHVNPYLTGARGLLTTNGLKLLNALGLVQLTAEWRQNK